MPVQLMGLGFAIFSVGICGMAASRHFLVMMMSSEIAIAASALLSVMFFYFSTSGSILVLLLSLWTVALMEVMALVVVYRHLTRMQISLNVTKLSNLKN